MGKTVGLIGYGNNGSATARRLSGFGCRVLAYDKYRDNYGDAFATESSMEEIQHEADILSLHIPLTDITRYLVNEEFIGAFAKPFYLLNLSRGEVVKLKAVTEALESGKIAGAGLDVLENEKLDTYSETEKKELDWLLHQPNVLITPHTAGYSHEAFYKMATVVMEKLGI